ncbi:TVP38/TMEM64 family protein [Virgibacillus halodenitrificans]|uniref:TVP38/TMEM64 family protein n=1 Tax=Virgibacillus halodenitrificans TaxID=1482 RepID=UPI0003175364|nr:TVP38/TMEM64 family protein [Virgibacillus halodenitrificans]MCG1029505.1 TVP38/TMEM64 family protein [Virgibacillus halodenitrificans]MCJ0932282.1 TVP38/TMEM64 family protein [Virgibacillus halodenitrificans]MEC2158598.1 TVP38/TMEM64 family protein [Virgibacillus halodenitrificans]MYL47629.1 TVP38/TMEM64 family protein [Virgibacillus halodenitrificans]MYL56526.1 TVP38/TMEM64 family protein [Virgibacillus halodenitrificans]
MYLMDIQLSNWRMMLENDQLDEYIMQLLNNYENLGPIPGILLPFIEAFLPFLPLVVFVFANAAAYGLLEGFLLSWAGSSLGAILVFFIIRRLGDKKVFRSIRKNRQVQKVTAWLERHGFGPLFLLMCFPFSPSAVINVVAGLSKISIQQFILAVILGKSVMIFSLAYIGSSILEFAKNPMKTVIVGIGIVLFWGIGKLIEKHLEKKAQLKERNG